jgi:hypothetical protein
VYFFAGVLVLVLTLVGLTKLAADAVDFFAALFGVAFFADEAFFAADAGAAAFLAEEEEARALALVAAPPLFFFVFFGVSN